VPLILYKAALRLLLYQRATAPMYGDGARTIRGRFPGRDQWRPPGLIIFTGDKMHEIEEKLGSLISYRDALPEDDRQAFDRLIAFARARVGACAKASKLTVLESMLLAMVIEQQKILEHARGSC
jgi:hypothetical protein